MTFKYKAPKILEALNPPSKDPDWSFIFSSDINKWIKGKRSRKQQKNEM